MVDGALDEAISASHGVKERPGTPEQTDQMSEQPGGSKLRDDGAGGAHDGLRAGRTEHVERQHGGAAAAQQAASRCRYRRMSARSRSLGFRNRGRHLRARVRSGAGRRGRLAGGAGRTRLARASKLLTRRASEEKTTDGATEIATLRVSRQLSSAWGCLGARFGERARTRSQCGPGRHLLTRRTRGSIPARTCPRPVL